MQRDPSEMVQLLTMLQQMFTPEGAGYDMQGALAAGMRPDVTGHWGSRDPRTGLMLKGRAHPTWPLAVQGEGAVGNEIIKQDGRYYSRPRLR